MKRRYSADRWPDASWRIFAEDSPWNTLRDHSKVHPDSDAMIANLVADGPPSSPPHNVRVNWGTPLYFGRRRDPLYTILTEHGDPDSRAQHFRQIHCPEGVKPSAASDGVMWVIDQTTGWVNQLQRSRQDPATGAIHCWKSFRFHSDGDGFPDLPTGAPTGIMPIRPEELAAGHINHTMSMGCKSLCPGPVPPYENSATIGKGPAGSQRLHMGSVVFLDMAHEEIDAIPNAGFAAKAVLKGLADYGAVVGLNGGSPWALKFENPLDRMVFGHPDPYAALSIGAVEYDKVDWRSKLKVAEPFPRP